MAIQHDLEPREPSGPETTFPKLPFCSPEPKYCGTFPEPTAKATRCGWTTTCITTCYRFLRRALLCRSKGNKTLAPTKNVDAKKNDTRTCANMNCERHALDEKCSKYPATFKRCCSQECYLHAKLNGTLESPTKLTVWPVIPGHDPLPKIKLKVIGNDSNINQQPEETAVLCMYMVQNTVTLPERPEIPASIPVPTVRLCAIGQVKPGLRWLCTLPSTRRPQRSTSNKYKTIYEPAEMNLSDTEFDAEDADMAPDTLAPKFNKPVSKRVPDNFHTDLRELVGDIPKSTPAKELVPGNKTSEPITRSKASGVNKLPIGEDKAAGGFNKGRNLLSVILRHVHHLSYLPTTT